MINESIIFLAMFSIAQSLYFICNIVYLSLLIKTPQYVKKKEPIRYKRIHSMVALYEEPKNLLKANFESQLNSDYPKGLIDIYPIVEEKDKKTVEIVKELAREMPEVHPIIIPNNGDGDWPDVIKKWTKVCGSQYDGITNLPFGKGRALTYAYYSDRSDLKNSDILTVFDSEDIIDPKLFKYATAGLEQGFDIVQGKIRYRNTGTNILTALESIEPLIWSNIFYTHVSNKDVPFQVLGPAYFFSSKLPEEVCGWSPYTTSEDVEFGLRCWERRNELGILDIYTDELGVNTLDAWIKQRRRWTRGHQKVFLENRLRSFKSKFYFFTYSLNSQLMAMIGLIGVPSGIYMLGETLLGISPQLNPILSAICIFNLGSWIFSGISIMNNYKHLGKFNSKSDELIYYIRVNPITTMFYSALWSIPITLGIKDCMSSKKVSWEKTPREGFEDSNEICKCSTSKDLMSHKYEQIVEPA